MNALAELIQTATRGPRHRRYRLALAMRREFAANETSFWTDGAANGDIDDVNNWSATEGGASGAAVPNGSGTAHFNRGSHSLVSGTLSCATINIREGFGGDASGITIGTESAALSMTATTKLFISNERCQFIKVTGAQGIVDLAKLGGSRFYLAGGSVTTMYVAAGAGYWELEDDVELTYLFAEGMSGLIKGDATSPVAAVFSISAGAKVECWREYEVANVSGILDLAQAADATATSRTFVNNGGTLVTRQSGGLAGTSSGFLHVQRGGTLDASKANYPFTIARLIRGLFSTIKLNTQNVTVTAAVEIGGTA